jgi:hypothetical protein
MALKFVLNTAPLYRLGEMLDRKLDEAAEKLAEETVEHWEVFAGMDYAAAVEYGSQGRAARPYLTPAMEEAKEKMPAVIAEALNAAAKEAGGRG